MKITYDRSAPIAGIGLVPWTRLGPERWFDDYKIASLYGWDLQDVPGVPKVYALADKGVLPTLKKLNTQQLLETTEFQQLITSRLAGYDFLTYKPTQPPQILLDAGCRFLSMNQKLTKTLENKAAFRAQFADLGLSFPAYRLFSRQAVSADDAGLRAVLGGQEAVILQDDMLSGGRGTFRVSSTADLACALTAIEKLGGGTQLVVSNLIADAAERTVQCCVTRYGVFVGPLQKQIVGHPLLANLSVTDGDRFCGAEITPHDTLMGVYPEIQKYAKLIGARLQEKGYRGIFGLDCLVDTAGKVYVLEINPRLTGVTPLLTMLYREGRDIPFYLLHMLETGGLDYKIEDDSVDTTGPEGGLIILHAQNTRPSHIVDVPASGMYDMDSLAFRGKQYRLETSGDDRAMLVQQYTPPDFTIKPGGRLVTGFMHGRILDDEDRLEADVAHAAQVLLQRITLKEIDL